MKIQYIGNKQRKIDHWCGSNLTWHGPGDVQEITDPKVVGKLLQHDDVWRVYDPTAPLPVRALLPSSSDAAGLLATFGALMQQIQANPAVLLALGMTPPAGQAAAHAAATAAPPPAPTGLSAEEEVAMAREAAVKAAALRVASLAADPMAAPYVEDGTPTVAKTVMPAPIVAAPAAPAETPAVANVAGDDAAARAELIAKLQAEAKGLGVVFKESWGAGKLGQAINLRRKQLADTPAGN